MIKCRACLEKQHWHPNRRLSVPFSLVTSIREGTEIFHAPKSDQPGQRVGGYEA